MNLDDILSFTDHTLQPEEVLGEAVFYFGLPKQLEQVGWRTGSNNSTFKPILKNAMIRNEKTLVHYHHENDLEELDSDLQDLIKQCQKILKQCLPFDCKVEESEFNFSSQQTSYHSFPVRKRQSLLISNSGESSKRSENIDEILHAHVLTIRTALTDRQKMELKQVQSTDHSSRQRFEADVTWLKLNAPRTICFISKYSLHSLFADILRFAQLRYGDNDDRFSEFLHHCIFTPVTSLGQQIQVKITSLENDLCFIHDSTFTTTTKDKLTNSNPTLNILPATINKQQIFDAISFLFEPTIINRRIAIVSDSITLLSFCLKEFEELLISIPNWNGIVHPILHHTDLHSIIAKEQGKYVIPVQRRMSHILSMTDFHIIDLDGEEVSKERSSSRLSKWLPSTTRIRSKQESKSINSSDWFDRNMFEFNSNLFHNVGRIEVVSDTHSGDLSFESLDISERSWTIQEIVPEIPSNQVQQPTKLLSRRKSILFGTKRRVLSSSSVKDVTSSKVIESIESSMNEDRGIVPQLPKLEEYQIGPIANEEPEEEATNDTITAVDQPLSRNKEEKKWQDVRIRMEKSRSNIDIISQRKRNRRIGKIFEDSRVEEISNHDDDEDADDSPDALSIIAQNLEAKETIETLQTPRSHVTGFTSTTESMPLTPTIAQNVRTSKQQQESSSPQPPPPPPQPSPERSRTPVIRSSGFDWLEDVECMQAQLQQTIQRLEFENSQQFNSSDQNDEEYARIWKAFYSTPPQPSRSNRSLFVFDNVIDDTTTEFHKINQWRNDVQNHSNSNSNLPQKDDLMTMEIFFDDGHNNRRLRRGKPWNSL